MSDVSLRDELMTLLVAGQETSAILLGWASALLAHNPQIQVGDDWPSFQLLSRTVALSHPGLYIVLLAHNPETQVSD